MTKRTMQEEFDIVVEHLATQKVRSADSEDHCQYRGPDGLKCAIGALIPDEEYLPEFDEEGVTVSVLLDEHSVSTLRKNRTDFYGDLQVAHDAKECWDSEGFTGWFRLKEVARYYNLNTKTLHKYVQQLFTNCHNR